jgi:hypothetical protein
LREFVSLVIRDFEISRLAVQVVLDTGLRSDHFLRFGYVDLDLEWHFASLLFEEFPKQQVQPVQSATQHQGILQRKFRLGHVAAVTHFPQVIQHAQDLHLKTVGHDLALLSPAVNRRQMHSEQP